MSPDAAVDAEDLLGELVALLLVQVALELLEEELLPSHDDLRAPLDLSERRRCLPYGAGGPLLDGLAEILGGDALELRPAGAGRVY